MSNLTIGDLIENVADQFGRTDLAYGHGTDNAWDEAVALVLHLTGASDDRQELTTQVPDAVIFDVFDMAQRRIEHRTPLPYLLGSCTFMGEGFLVRPGLVVPRSPIGYLLGERLRPWAPERVNHVLDLCSGTGCLGILAAKIYTDAQVTLVDVAPLAVTVAQENIAQHGLADRVEVVQIDVKQPAALISDLTTDYDLILANPPYVDAEDMSALPLEFQAEPAHGLAAGKDGLSVMRAILAELPGLLTHAGLFVGEIGASTPALIRAYPQWPFIWPDLDLGGEGVFLLEAQGISSHTARG